MTVSFIRKSSNSKTGPIPVTYSSARNCPDACSLKGAGCYAEGGNVSIHWHHVTSGTRGLAFEAFLDAVRTLPDGQLWRHNVAGDLEGANNRINASKLRALAHANQGKRGFTYTHKPLTAANVRAIREACEAGFTVNLSADGLRQADVKARHGLPVVVVLPADAPTKGNATPEGRPVVVCPAQLSDAVTCSSCGLCQKADRKSIVGFLAHGMRAKAVTRRLQVVQ